MSFSVIVALHIACLSNGQDISKEPDLSDYVRKVSFDKQRHCSMNEHGAKREPNYPEGTPCEVDYIGCSRYESFHKQFGAGVEILPEGCYLHDAVEFAVTRGMKYVAIARNSWCGEAYAFDEIPKMIAEKLDSKKPEACGDCCVDSPGYPCGRERFVDNLAFVESLAIYRVNNPCLDDPWKCDDETVCAPPAIQKPAISTAKIFKYFTITFVLLAFLGGAYAITTYYKLLDKGMILANKWRSPERNLGKEKRVKGTPYNVLKTFKKRGEFLHRYVYPAYKRLENPVLFQIFMAYCILMITIAFLVLWNPKSSAVCYTAQIISSRFSRVLFTCETEKNPLVPFAPPDQTMYTMEELDEVLSMDGRYRSNKITRLVHGIVDYGRVGGEIVVPQSVSEFAGTCASEAEWPYKVWTMKDGRSQVERTARLLGWNVPYFMSLYDRTFEHYRYDILKTSILWLYGGLFTDNDVICFKSPERLFMDPDTSFFLGTTRLIEGSFVAASKFHPFTVHVLNEQRRILERGSLILQSTYYDAGQGAFQRAYNRAGNELGVKLLLEVDVDSDEQVTVFNVEDFPRRNVVTAVHVHSHSLEWSHVAAQIASFMVLIFGAMFLVAGVLRFTICRKHHFGTDKAE